MKEHLTERNPFEVPAGRKTAATSSGQNFLVPVRLPVSTENLVLGIVWRDGPCTTYHLMVQLASSPSGPLRRRASSTYGIVEKLLARGLVEPINEEVGPRGERQLRVSEAGFQTLRDWIREVPDEDVAQTNDPVRLRTNFLEALSPEEQIEFVDQALRKLRYLVLEQEESIRTHPHIRPMALRGLIYETRARIAWLEEVRAELLGKSGRSEV